MKNIFKKINMSKTSHKTMVFSAIGVCVLTLSLGLGLGLGLQDDSVEKRPFGISARQYLQNEASWNLSYIDDAKNAKLVSVVDETRAAKKSSMMYELLVYAFSDGDGDGIGDFHGATEKIDYLDSLGIDSLWLSPIHEAPSYHAYDVMDYTSVSNDIGGMEGFDRFLKAAHEKGIKVYLDLVLNHTSAMHPWFQKALKGEQKYKDYYQFNKGSGKSEDIGFPAGQTFLANNWVGMPDVNGGNETVIEEFEAVIEFWVKKGVDGFRFDLFRDLYNAGEPRPTQETNTPVQYFYSRLKEKADTTRRKITNDSTQEVFFLGEGKLNEAAITSAPYLTYTDSSNEVKPALNSIYDGGFLRGVKNLDLFESTTTSITSRLGQLRTEAAKVNNYETTWTPFLDNHDESRWIHNFRKNTNVASDPLTTLDYHALRYGLLGTVLLPGTPILFQGTELGYHSVKPDPDIREPLRWNDGKDIEFKQIIAYNNPTDALSETDYIRINNSKDIRNVRALQSDGNSILNDFISFMKIRKQFPWISSLNVSMSSPETQIPQLTVGDGESIFGYAEEKIISPGAKRDVIVWLGTNPESSKKTTKYNLTGVTSFSITDVAKSKGVIKEGNTYTIPVGDYIVLNLKEK